MPPKGEKRSRKQAKVDVGEILRRVEQDIRHESSDKDTAKAMGIAPSTYSHLKSGQASPTWDHLEKFHDYFREPVTTFIPKGRFARERDRLRWQLGSGLRAVSQRTSRDVAERVLQGDSPDDIARLIATREGAGDSGAVERAKAKIAWMARSGLGFGLVEPLIAIDASEIRDPTLADELARALASHARPPRPVAVHVVRNFAHPDFERDPIVPFLVARVAHELVARILKQHPHARTVGIAGGIHLATFVRTVGLDSSPFPEGGDRCFVLLPLTFEPFRDHRFELADALVGELHARVAMLLGPPRVEAPSFQPFGYLEDHRPGPLETDSVTIVRQRYNDLDVAAFGCGDRRDDGWIEWTERILALRLDRLPATDVCLNMLDETGEPIPLPDRRGVREYLGIGLDEIRALARRKDKLALLLASGASKGLPITLVARAGCCNAVVCDQSAAKAALAALRGGAAPAVE